MVEIVGTRRVLVEIKVEISKPNVKSVVLGLCHSRFARNLIPFVSCQRSSCAGWYEHVEEEGAGSW